MPRQPPRKLDHWAMMLKLGIWIELRGNAWTTWVISD